MDTPIATSHATSRRRFIRLTGGGFVAAALPLGGCSLGAAMPDSAIAPWSEAKDDPDIRLWALSWAILAPNPHNRQPWLAALAGHDTLLLSLDTDRLLPETDPFGRQILIGTGAFLGLLELAAAQRGFGLNIEHFPAGAFGEKLDDRPVARIQFKPNQTVSATEKALFEHVPQRHTYRGPYLPDSLPGQAFSDQFAQESNVLNAMSLHSGLINRTDQAKVFTALDKIAREAWKIELTTPHTMMESIELLRIGSDEIAKHRDGISITDPMLIVIDKLGLLDRTSAPAPDSMAVTGQIDDFDLAMTSTPSLYWLNSRDNSRLTQLNVGRAYLRAQLLATAHGLVMHPMSQALQEYDEMAAQYEHVHRVLRKHTGEPAAIVQMLCRIGRPAAGPQAPSPSPRRGVKAHLVV